MQNQVLFGGKMVVLTGDWRQTLPVARGRANTVNATHLHADQLWPAFRLHELKINMRIERLRRRDPAAATRLAAHDEWLLSLGEGRLGTETVDIDGQRVDDTRRVALPNEMVFRGEGLDKFLDHMYPGFHEHAAAIDVHSDVPIEHNAWAQYVTARTILAPKREHVADVNERMLKRMPGVLHESLSLDRAIDDASGVWSTELCNLHDPAGLPPHRLLLKVHANTHFAIAPPTLLRFNNS